MDRVLADLHNHLKTGGWFGRVDADKVVERANLNLGKNGVLGITDYLPAKRYEDFVDSVRHDLINLGNAVYIPERELLVMKTSEVMVNLPNGRAEILGIG